ncbi:hypothetical protein ELH45_14995 [Rhizobium ruizarguesonis]|nr:hypothetical protein ELH45_14995 [Rhizobium ruizarguesonis]
MKQIAYPAEFRLKVISGFLADIVLALAAAAFFCELLELLDKALNLGLHIDLIFFSVKKIFADARLLTKISKAKRHDFLQANFPSLEFCCHGLLVS